MPAFTAYVLRRPNFSGDVTTSLQRLAEGAVAVPLEAEDLEHVFAQLNHDSGCTLPGYAGRSLSVGDVVSSLGPRGPARWVVSPLGFTRCP